MSLNILFIIDSLGAGGAEKVVLTLAYTMKKMGHQAIIITADDHIGYEIDFDIDIYTLDFKKERWENSYQKYGTQLQKLVEKLESKFGKFNLITSHLQKSHRLTNIANLENAYYCIHSTISKASLQGRNGFRRYLKIRRLKSLLDNKKIITVSKGIQEDLLSQVHINPKTIKTIYNPLDFEKISILSSEPNPYKNENYIISVGRLEPAKRHDILLKAYSKLKIKQKLLLLGDGSQLEPLKTLAKKLGIEERVIFTGFLHNPYKVLKDAKLFIATSEYEGFMITLAEALFLRVPAISTNCKYGPAEILEENLSQYLIPVCDINATANKISELLSSNYNFSHAGKSLQRFDVESIAKEYLKLSENRTP